MADFSLSSLQRWNTRYGADGLLFGAAPNRYLQSKAAYFKPGMSALCIADGEGRNSVWLAGLGLCVDAFDISDVGIGKARALAAQAGVQVNYQVSSCDQWPWQSESHDAVVAIFMQFADPDMRKRLFESMRRALRPGGILVLLGYSPQQLVYKTGGPGELDHLYTTDLLTSAFSDLSILELESFEEILNEGSGHCGQSALIGLVARA
jgi:SAM-dependent methyltransferase